MGDRAPSDGADAHHPRWGGGRWVRREDPHVLGDPAAPVGIVVWGDFCCPYCAAAAPILTDLVSDGSDRFALSFRHFPRADVHPTAFAAHQLSEAAHDQDRFWPMHDLLYGFGGDLTTEALDECASRLHVRARDRHVAERQHRVERDRDAGVAAGVVATPGIYVAGAPYVGELSRERLLRAANGSR